MTANDTNEEPFEPMDRSRLKSALFLGLLFFFLCLVSPQSLPDLPLPDMSLPETQLTMTEGQVKRKHTLYRSFIENKIPLRWIDLIVSEMKPFMDFRRITGGIYRLITDGDGELVQFVFEKSPIEVYHMQKGPQGYRTLKIEVPLDKCLTKVEGEIRSSLFEAIEDCGERDELTLSFAEILAWEIDFYQDLRKGDKFKIIVEKIYKENQFIQYGAIRALEYQTEKKIIRGIRYQGDYYDEKGNSLRKAFLKAPLRFDRISSRFSHARRHPILGGLRPHLGVDYAAPIGTPVWAVADGTVISAGWQRGYGKQVVLQHGNGYKTCYGHLSRYGPGIRKSNRVSQKQVIGYVGSTGLSTGPHLDYRLAKDGRFRNPLKETLPSGFPIKESHIKQFHKRRNEMVTWLTKDIPKQKRLARITSDAL